MIEKEIFKNVPEYYHWMCLDGYTPEQIRYAFKKTVLKNSEKDDDEEVNIRIVSTVKKI